MTPNLEVTHDTNLFSYMEKNILSTTHAGPGRYGISEHFPVRAAGNWRGPDFYSHAIINESSL
jgi:hypothetical protein